MVIPDWGFNETIIPTNRDWSFNPKKLVLHRMTQVRRNRTNTLIGTLLIAVFSMLLTNNIVYQHIHILENGQIICHAHPFNKSPQGAPFQQHNHTTAEYSVIAVLALLFLNVMNEIQFESVEYVVLFNSILQLRVSVACLDHQWGRSPPTTQFS